MKEFIFFFCCSVLAVVPLFFVMHKVYQDGVFGRMALLGISFAAMTFISERIWAGIEYDILPQNVMMIASFTVFLVWHLVRWHSRVLTAKKAERGEIERRAIRDEIAS